MSIRSIRERINLSIYSHKASLLKNFRILSLLVSIVAVSTLIYYHGFPHNAESKIFLIGIIKVSFAFFVFHYFLRVFYDFHPLHFIRDNWFEGIMMLMLVVDGISDKLFNVLIIERFFVGLGFHAFPPLSTIFIQFYLLIVVVVNVFRTSHLIPKIKIHPSTIFILSFLAMILGGTFLLMLPEMTTIDGSMSFVDALFTATSANCVTGLIVVETATFFTFKGQLVILLLIKLGGLNIVMFGSFLALASKFGFGVKHHEVIEGFVNKESLLSAKGMMGKIFIWSLFIEIISSILVFLFWDPQIQFRSLEEKVFFSVFHSMSAFNNAGFSVFIDGLFNEMVRQNYLVHIVLGATIFLGSLGFVAIFDLFSIRNMRNRMKFPWKEVDFGTKIALNYSIILVVGGAVLFMVLERDNSLAGTSFFEALVTSVFQSIVPRTAGYNTVDFGILTTPVIFMMIVLMFIGASSSSTGGGVKTSSIALMFASVYSTIVGKKNVELYKRNIPTDLINNAVAIVIFYCSYIVVSVFILSITEMETLSAHGKGFLDLLFENVSAMSTVGLTTGVTPHLSTFGKLVIALSMFVGRVGTITIVFAVAKSVISTNYKYPNAHTLVG